MDVIELRTKVDCRHVMEQSLIGVLFGGIVRTKFHHTIEAILIHMNRTITQCLYYFDNHLPDLSLPLRQHTTAHPWHFSFEANRCVKSGSLASSAPVANSYFVTGRQRVWSSWHIRHSMCPCWWFIPSVS